MKRFEIGEDWPREYDVIGGTDRSQAAVRVIQPHTVVGRPEDRHPDSDQWVFVLSGTGRAVVDGREAKLAPGTLLLVEAGEPHEFHNETEAGLVTVSIFSPPPSH